MLFLPGLIFSLGTQRHLLQHSKGRLHGDKPELQGELFPKPKQHSLKPLQHFCLPSFTGRFGTILSLFLLKASKKGTQVTMQLKLCQGDPDRASTMSQPLCSPPHHHHPLRAWDKGGRKAMDREITLSCLAHKTKQHICLVPQEMSVVQHCLCVPSMFNLFFLFNLSMSASRRSVFLKLNT